MPAAEQAVGPRYPMAVPASSAESVSGSANNVPCSGSCSTWLTSRPSTARNCTVVIRCSNGRSGPGPGSTRRAGFLNPQVEVDPADRGSRAGGEVLRRDLVEEFPELLDLVLLLVRDLDPGRVE